MNYTSVQEILDAGITNMSILRNNSKQDDGTDTVSGADWFSFNGTAATNVYVNGNSWFGFGSSNEHLKVNRRDAAMYYLYREEGTLYNFYRFLKFRWSGYTAYGATDSASKLTYDVILWESGDISVHIVDWPTSNNTGTYALAAGTTFTFTVSVDQPDVTFYYADGTYTVANEVSGIRVPFDMRYLLRCRELLYTIVDDVLTELGETEVTTALFQASGMTTVPQWEQISSLENPEILLWYDSEEIQPEIKAVMTATPFQQIIITNEIDLSESTITGVEYVSTEYEGNPLYACSFDGGESWQAHNGAEWIEITSETGGMSAEALTSIGVDQWTEVITGLASFLMRFTLSEAEDKVTNIVVHYTN